MGSSVKLLHCKQEVLSSTPSPGEGEEERKIIRVGIGGSKGGGGDNGTEGE